VKSKNKCKNTKSSRGTTKCSDVSSSACLQCRRGSARASSPTPRTGPPAFFRSTGLAAMTGKGDGPDRAHKTNYQEGTKPYDTANSARVVGTSCATPERAGRSTCLHLAYPARSIKKPHQKQHPKNLSPPDNHKSSTTKSKLALTLHHKELEKTNKKKTT
jgi:hypothetical protein